MECINCSTHWAPFILILSLKQTIPALNNQLYQTAVSACTADAFAIIVCSIGYKYPSSSTSTHKVSSLFLHTDFQAYSTSLDPCVNSLFLFQMAHPHDAEGWGYHPTKHPLQPGWDQSRGHLFLSHTAYSLHATYLSQWPTHSPLQGHIHANAIQHAP